MDASSSRGRKRERPEDTSVASYFGYHNENNPFNDSNLSSSFTWKLKRKKLLKEGVDPNALSEEQEMKRREELKREIEKLKLRRQQREEERARMEAERERLNRERDMRTITEFEKEEDQFLFTQLKTRALFRLRQGRPKSVDWLMLYYLHASREYHAQLRAEQKAQRTAVQAAAGEIEEELPTLPTGAMSPLEILALVWNSAITSESAGRTLRPEERSDEPSGMAALAKLRDDTKLFVDLEEATNYPGGVPGAENYWLSCFYILDDLVGGHGVAASLLAPYAGRSAPPTPTPAASTAQATTQVHSAIAEEIHNMLKGKSSQELTELEVQIHTLLREGAGVEEEFYNTVLSRLKVYRACAILNEIFKRIVNNSRDSEQNSSDSDRQQAGESEYINTSDTVLPEALSGAAAVAASTPLSEDELYRRESAREMEQGEEIFVDEQPVQTIYDKNDLQYWQEKYRPRKPKYFNRVKSGYEWNKYNRTHYDADNPPPKIIQGYKFNIFYPDLIDKTKTPKYFLEKADSPDYVILRFHAGPPYEDIAFKIVNREWEYSHKRGFKCVFAGGVLQLWFNFKRYGYRR